MELLERVLDSKQIYAETAIINVSLIIFFTYLANKYFIKANKKTFIFSQLIFIASVAVLLILALQSVARGIMMNA